MPKLRSVVVSAANPVAACATRLDVRSRDVSQQYYPPLWKPASKVLLNFVSRCNQWVPLSQVSPRNARLSTPNPISGHGVDDVSLVSPDRGALNVSCLIFWVRCGKAVRA